MNLIIILVVVICNAGKLAGMLYVAFGPLEDPLITMGDAVSSFLASPDNTTRDMCLVNRKEVVTDILLRRNGEPAHSEVLETSAAALV